MILTLIAAVAVPPMWATIWGAVLRYRPGSPAFWGSWAGSAVGYGATAVAYRDWLSLAACAVQVILGAIFWWLSRRRRKKAPRSYGAKSRALLAAVVARMRETLKPKPVFRPAPGGAA